MTVDEENGMAEVINGIRQDCGLGVWDNAFDEAEERRFDELFDVDADAAETFAHGAEWGARWLAAIVGMADAISRIPSIEACPMCGEAATSWVIGAMRDGPESPWQREKICAECFDEAKRTADVRRPTHDPNLKEK